MIKKYQKEILSAIILILLLAPTLLLAANLDASRSDLEKNLMEGASNAGYKTTGGQSSIAVLAGTVVRMFLSLLGIIFIGYTIYAGYLWMTAGGNEENVTKAKNILRNVVIGLIVVLASAAIYLFIKTAFTGAE
ncbi:MAG: hypothetical protein WC675_04285 [Patescibacteria group bacterium]|jgi:hypothetical protein